MSRLFDDSLSEYLSIEVPAITAYPLAMACWFKTNDDAVHQALMWVGDKDVADAFCSLYINHSEKSVRATTAPGGGMSAETTTDWAKDTWHHTAGIYLNVSERHAYLDGGGKGSNTNEAGAMANYDRTAVGYHADSTPTYYFSGDIAEAAIWNLTAWGANDAARETNFEKAIASMAKGYSPAHFPLGLVAYWPLVRNTANLMTGQVLGESGTTVSEHCRVFNPTPRRSVIS